LHALSKIQYSKIGSYMFKQISQHRPNIAILGFAKITPLFNNMHAYQISHGLISAQCNLYIGNHIGMYRDIIRCCHQYHGTLTLLTTDPASSLGASRCAQSRSMTSTAQKHQRLIQLCDGAILIGGGLNSLIIIRSVIALNKPVVALQHSGGIVANELPKRCIRANGAHSAVSIMLRRLKNARSHHANPHSLGKRVAKQYRL